MPANRPPRRPRPPAGGSRLHLRSGTAKPAELAAANAAIDAWQQRVWDQPADTRRQTAEDMLEALHG